MSASSVVAGQEPSSAANSRSLSVSIVRNREVASRPIAKGRLGKRVEFGYKGQIVDNDDGIVLDHDVQAGNPADAKQLAPAIQRVKDRAGRAPRTVTAGMAKLSSTTPWPTWVFAPSSFPAKGNPAWPDNSWNDAEPSAEPSNGEPDANAASAPSNAHTAGTAPAWTASRERKPGPDEGYTPTT
jgi:hypothetical protein